MCNNLNIRICAKLLVIAAIAFLAPVVAQAANTMNITYYTISSSDPDADNLSFGTVNNEVQNSLGLNGLPVLNTPEFGCTLDCFSLPKGPTNLTSSGEITYWSPSFNAIQYGTSYVTQTGTGTVTLPVCLTTCIYGTPYNFFPPNGTGGGDGGSIGYQAAVLSGILTVPTATSEKISFNIGADDMAFAYLDGNVVCDLGGVHASTTGTCTTSTIGAGNHSLKVFFVDINQYQAGLAFGVNTSNITTTAPVPEPETYAMLLAGLGLICFIAYRRKRDSSDMSMAA